MKGSGGDLATWKRFWSKNHEDFGYGNIHSQEAEMEHCHQVIGVHQKTMDWVSDLKCHGNISFMESERKKLL